MYSFTQKHYLIARKMIYLIQLDIRKYLGKIFVFDLKLKNHYSLRPKMQVIGLKKSSSVTSQDYIEQTQLPFTLQDGGLPAKCSWQLHTAVRPITRHSELAPHGLGWQGSDDTAGTEIIETHY
jgi:hypothetical protein